MSAGFDGSSVDGSVYADVVRLAGRTPGWLDGAVALWSTYGLVLFALLMVWGWWRARTVSAEAAVTALAAPVLVVVAFAVDLLVKSAVRETRPCRSLHLTTLEACPAPDDWSFPSNHAAIAAAAAVAVWFVSRRLGALAAVAALAMAASRVWVGAHYPHDVAAGFAVGAGVALVGMSVLRRRPSLAQRLATSRLRFLLLTAP
ncbi:phosphatase PAP2 family protein [Streptomyces endophyticus]|uniref:Phosphatase PAP2 family protein n=1 Tax=Streptomyces endophyticus TaxID=714166 RepID=A0ABU6F5M9_9ACTN|nr:phosphatase PAP2 family protein [Streptomyces endophyticus]MEB8339324.1 phosphatase PAP2 family protein [Streptomyces endophyticus]